MKATDKKQNNFLRKLNYRKFSTSADVGLEVWGKDLVALFQNAAQGLRFLLFGVKVKLFKNLRQNGQPYSFQLAADSPEDFLVKMLSEILFLLDHRQKIFIDQELILNKQNVICNGFLIKNRWQPFLEIKAVTYHNLRLTKKGERYYIKIVFDL